MEINGDHANEKPPLLVFGRVKAGRSVEKLYTKRKKEGFRYVLTEGFVGIGNLAAG